MPTPDPKRVARGLWWDRAWGVIQGCTPVSPGCDNCWSAEQTRIRAKQTNPKIRSRYEGLTGQTGKFCGKIRLMESDIGKPLRVRKPTVWAVWNDLFHKDVPFGFIDRVQLMKLLCPQHTFLTLTKRPGRMAEYYSGDWYHNVVSMDWFDRLNRECLDKADDATQEAMGRSFGAITCGPHESRFLPNDWRGTTVENQEMADLRIPHLMRCPAAVRFLSCEPLLGYFVLPSLGFTGPQTMVDWLIIGPETGLKRRPCKPEWFEGLIDQADAAGIPVFIKAFPINGHVSKNPAEWPEWARRREFPERKEPSP